MKPADGIIPTEDGLLVLADARALMARVPSDAVAVVYLDPPHGAGVGWDQETDPELRNLLVEVVQHAKRVISPTGNLFYTIPPAGALPADAFDARFVLKQVFGTDPLEISRRLLRVGNMRGAPRSDREVTLWIRASENSTYNPVTQQLEVAEAYPWVDERGRFRLVDLTSRRARPNLQFTWQGISPPPNRSWAVSRERMQALAAEGRLQVSGRTLRRKVYVDEAPSREVPLEWDDIPPVPSPIEHEYLGGGHVPGQKPLDLMHRLIAMGSEKHEVVLDPFCGTGTTLVAAHRLGRRWIGADASPEVFALAKQRLSQESDLRPTGWELQRDVLVLYPSFTVTPGPVLAHIGQIEELRQQIDGLAKSLDRIKSAAGLEGEDPDSVVQRLEQRIESFFWEARPATLERYVERVRAWLVEWDRLEKASQRFLPQAEFLMDVLPADGSDFSPFIIQYCRALENEIVQKLFIAYSEDLTSRVQDKRSFLADALDDQKTRRFAKGLLGGIETFALGDMVWTMGLIKLPGGRTLERSKVLQDFRDFTERYFGNRVRDAEFLDRIDQIRTDFRNKAAHPYLLDLQTAEKCREAVRSCLSEFLRNYKAAAKEGD